jgi:hypothetical protein
VRFLDGGELNMPLKRTYVHRGYVIQHRVFGSEVTAEMIHQFSVSLPGNSTSLRVMGTLDEAKAAIDEIVESDLNSSASGLAAVSSSGTNAGILPATSKIFSNRT